MAETIGYDEVVRMLSAAVEKIRGNHRQLSKLDSATGDGDHGTAMSRAVDAVQKVIDNDPPRALKPLLNNIAWGVMGIDGGSTGPLFGSLFLGLSDGVGDNETLDCAALAAMFEAGLAKVQKQSKAQVGDKTMMDALIPAVEALRKAAEGDDTIDEALRRAAEAARQGADATAAMQAKFGRAKNLGQRTVGHVDPGAASTAYLFEGFCEGIGD
ncbi:MAG TPA: dihydroxyacetone kinase subunit DhaL [Thermoguttaceae bacterium]|nr:dihydroxyacetone kinase subunit DhaL [Thermoguttaceae bacterium]